MSYNPDVVFGCYADVEPGPPFGECELARGHEGPHYEETHGRLDCDMSGPICACGHPHSQSLGDDGADAGCQMLGHGCDCWEWRDLIVTKVESFMHLRKEDAGLATEDT